MVWAAAAVGPVMRRLVGNSAVAIVEHELLENDAFVRVLDRRGGEIEPGGDVEKARGNRDSQDEGAQHPGGEAAPFNKPGTSVAAEGRPQSEDFREENPNARR